MSVKYVCHDLFLVYTVDKYECLDLFLFSFFIIIVFVFFLQLMQVPWQ